VRFFSAQPFGSLFCIVPFRILCGDFWWFFWHCILPTSPSFLFVFLCIWRPLFPFFAHRLPSPPSSLFSPALPPPNLQSSPAPRTTLSCQSFTLPVLYPLSFSSFCGRASFLFLFRNFPSPVCSPGFFSFFFLCPDLDSPPLIEFSGAQHPPSFSLVRPLFFYKTGPSLPFLEFRNDHFGPFPLFFRQWISFPLTFACPGRRCFPPLRWVFFPPPPVP